MTRRRSNSRSRGRPRESIYTAPPPTAEHSLTYWLARQRADFLAQPEKVRAETIARVELILESERTLWKSREEGHKGDPSQLARIAYRVYGLWLDWLPAHYQLDGVLLDQRKSAAIPVEPIVERDQQIEHALRAALGEVLL